METQPTDPAFHGTGEDKDREPALHARVAITSKGPVGPSDIAPDRKMLESMTRKSDVGKPRILLFPEEPMYLRDAKWGKESEMVRAGVARTKWGIFGSADIWLNVGAIEGEEVRNFRCSWCEISILGYVFLF